MKTCLIILILLTQPGLSESKERMIAAGGSITEIMYELGLEDQVIAVDSSSYFPHEVTFKPQVGYFRRLSSEGVLSLNPTHLIGSNGTGPDEAIDQISNTGVEVKVFNQEIYNLNAWKAYIREVAQYFELPDKAEIIITRVEQSLPTVENSSVQPQKTAIFIMDLGDRGPVAAGKNTVPNMLFKLAGINNVVEQYDGFKPFSAESLVQIKPDMIVMPDHVVKKLGGRERVCQNKTIQLATSKQGCHLLVMDALLALGFGTRIDQAVDVLLDHQAKISLAKRSDEH